MSNLVLDTIYPSGVRAKLHAALPQKITSIVNLPVPAGLNPGSWSVQLGATTDREGWLVVNLEELAPYIDSRSPEPRLGLPGAAGRQALLEFKEDIRDTLVSSWCPPGSIYRELHRAPLMRLTTHVPNPHLANAEDILVARAGGICTLSGRRKLVGWVPELRHALRTFNNQKLFGLNKLFQLMHVALRFADSDECLNPYTQAGVSWVGGYLHFHFGRALFNLPREVLYGETNIPPGAPLDYLAEEFRTIIGKKFSSPLDNVFVRTLVSPFSSVLNDIRLIRTLDTALQPLNTAGFIGVDEDYYNFKTSDDFSFYVDPQYATSLISFYKLVELKGFNLKHTAPVVAPLQSKKTPVKKATGSTRHDNTFSVMVDAYDLGYEHTNKALQRKGRPLSMWLHKSRIDEYYLSAPEELSLIMEPLVNAYITGRVMYVGEHAAVKAPLSWRKSASKQRRTFTFTPAGSDTPQTLFNMNLWAPGGPLITDLDVIIRRTKNAYDNVDFMNVYKAFKTFIEWIVNPAELLKNQQLTGELYAVVVDDDAVAPVYLKSSEARLEYLLKRGRNMDTEYKWDKLYALHTKKEDARRAANRLRSPLLTDYDKYAIHRALLELDLRKTHYLTRPQRAKYIVLRWLPWHTVTYIKGLITGSPEDNYCHGRIRMPRHDNDEAMRAFIRESTRKFGKPIITAVI